MIKKFGDEIFSKYKDVFETLDNANKETEKVVFYVILEF